ncbi:MAG: hypothetical protein AAGE61_00905 [Pseudomonadota bacterium]
MKERRKKFDPPPPLPKEHPLVISAAPGQAGTNQHTIGQMIAKALKKDKTSCPPKD